MPRLLAFLPCERVIVSSDDNSASVMTILQGFKFSGVKIPTDDEPVSLPLRWSIFTLWRRTSADEGVTYEQRAELISPSGKVLVAQTAEFVMVKANHRHTGRIFGFPVTGVGEYSLRLSLRALKEGEEYSVMAEYPLTIDVDLSVADSTPANQERTQQA